MKVGSLCSGIGGLDLAVEHHFAGELAWYSEIEPAPCQILERHWPGVPNLGDLTVVDWSDVEPVDVLTAGYPCQPFSHAGKRKGSKDARHIWPHIIEAVRHLRPRWVVAENVRGHLSLGFDEVLWSLAEAGFDAEWCVLRASDVGAPHQRARLWIVASDTRSPGPQGPVPPVPPGWQGPTRRPPADASRPERRGTQLDRMAPPVGSATEPGERPGPSAERRTTPSDADRIHDHRCGDRGEGRRHELTDRGGVDWGQHAPAIARWEAILGRPAPAPTDPQGRLSPMFVEWMMGYPRGWVTGLATHMGLKRSAALKALGNAVVPQQAAAALAELVPA